VTGDGLAAGAEEAGHGGRGAMWELLGQGLQVSLCRASVCTVLGIPQSPLSYAGHEERGKGHGWHPSKDRGEHLKRRPVAKKGRGGVGAESQNGRGWQEPPGIT